MNTFALAHTFTAEWEKGLVDHPHDPGGITNHGVSLRFLKNYAKNPLDREWLDRIGVRLPITPDVIRSLTGEQAKAIFKRAFWDALSLGFLPPLTAIVTYDAAVHSGTGQSGKFLQRACNTWRDEGEPLVVDGAIGPKTRNRAILIPDMDLADRCIGKRETFWHGLIAKSPIVNPDGTVTDYRSFQNGWFNRTAKLRRYICSLDLEATNGQTA